MVSLNTGVNMEYLKKKNNVYLWCGTLKFIKRGDLFWNLSSVDVRFNLLKFLVQGNIL